MSKKDEKKKTAEEMAEQPLEDEDILAELTERLVELEAEAAQSLDGWQRSQAEFANYRKRIERDQARLYEDTAARVIKKFLPILDDLNRALQDRPTEGEAGEWAGGMELIYRKLQSILEAENVTQMQSLGEIFDPNLHEAISQGENPEYESGQIIEVIQPGYMIGDRVLRAALVRVAS